MFGKLLFRLAWGAIAIVLGIFLAMSLRYFWQEWRVNNSGTIRSGWSRLVTFTALEEEDPASIMSTTLQDENKISAKGYILKDLETGQVIAAHNADRALPIASITKLVTAVVVKRLMSSDDRVTLSARVMKTYGNTADLTAGETIRASDLLYPLLMVSSNDAAEALAENYGRAEFIKSMNKLAQEIGAYHTYFADPSGLSPSNISTPTDLALILEWIRRNQRDVLDITELKTKTIRAHTWVNPTHFLNLSTYIGGKNGYLPEANRTGASLFEVEGHVYAVVVLNSSQRDVDELTLLAKVRAKK